MTDCILRMKDITKTFPGVTALKQASFSVRRGDIHALVGENGAGKSTLMKILSGVYQADSGEIFIHGEKVQIKNTLDARQRGIGLVFQEFSLVNTLSVAENIYLHRLMKRRGAIAWKQIYHDAQERIHSYGFRFSAKEKVENLSAAEKQLVEIIKVLSFDASIIVLDEPTSSLTSDEADKLFSIIRRLKEEGVTFVYISHKLDEVLALCDQTTVIRDGEIIETRPTQAFSKEEMIERMVGRSVEMEYPAKHSAPGGTLLKVTGLTRQGIFRDISFTLRRGEILGIAGLMGSGRTELAEAIFGAERCDAGNIEINGKAAEIRSTYDGKARGIGLLTEDRKETGLVLSYTLTRNISITNLKKISNKRMLSEKTEQDLTAEYARDLNVKAPSMKQLARNLSGGNQQKLVFAKWLFSGSDILILDEPTRGIDVGAKHEIYCLMNMLAEEGKGIIMISSELPEVLGMSDRVMVLSAGELVGELSREQASPEAVMRLAIKH